jgi:hypothetical protein
MSRIESPDDHPSADRSPRAAAAAVPAPIMRLMSGLRDRLKPNSYVDWSDIPDEPEPPYRARLTLPVEQSPDGLEVREREVVRGEITTIYEVRCPCGKRWFNPVFENVQICPRCSCAVLVQRPGTSLR